jgi:transposase InsO family protein
MESFHGRFKTEGHSLFLEAQTFGELRGVVGQQMCYYNTQRRHSSIGYLPPVTYIERLRSGLVPDKVKNREP